MMEANEQLVNHKSESAESESGQTGLTTLHGHVTSEAAATKGVGVKGDGVTTSSSKGTSSGGSGSGGSEVQLPAKQALAVLSNVSKCLLFIWMILSSCVLQVLSHFIDCVFDGSEKDKVISLLKSVMFNLWPHLHNHRLVYLTATLWSTKLLDKLVVYDVQMFDPICTTNQIYVAKLMSSTEK